MNTYGPFGARGSLPKPMKYQVISRFTSNVLIEGDDYTQPTKDRQHFLPDEQSQFRYMDDNNLTETMGICYFYIVNRSADECPK